MTAMANTPELSPVWPPTAGQLAMLATTGHWQLEELAYDLPRGAVTRERLDRTAAALEALAELLRRHQPESGPNGEVMGTSSGAGNPGELTPKLVAEFQAATDDRVEQGDTTEDPPETPDDDPDPTD